MACFSVRADVLRKEVWLGLLRRHAAGGVLTVHSNPPAGLAHTTCMSNSLFWAPVMARWQDLSSSLSMGTVLRLPPCDQRMTSEPLVQCDAIMHCYMQRRGNVGSSRVSSAIAIIRMRIPSHRSIHYARDECKQQKRSENVGQNVFDSITTCS